MCVLAGVLRSVLPSTLFMCYQVLRAKYEPFTSDQGDTVLTVVFKNTILLLATNFYNCYS